MTNGPDGEVVSIRYHELVPALLNHVQRKAKQISKLATQVTQLRRFRRAIAVRNGTHPASLAVFST